MNMHEGFMKQQEDNQKVKSTLQKIRVPELVIEELKSDNEEERGNDKNFKNYLG